MTDTAAQQPTMSRADQILGAVVTRLDMAMAGQSPSKAIVDIVEGLMRADSERLTGASQTAIEGVLAAMFAALQPLTASLSHAVESDDVVCALRCAAQVVRAFGAAERPDLSCEVDLLLVFACEVTAADARARLRAYRDNHRDRTAPAGVSLH